MAVLESNQPVFLAVRPDRVVPTRVIRRVKQEIYLDALKDHDMELTPLPGQVVHVRWAADDFLYEQAASITEVLDPIAIIVLKLTGQPRVTEQRGSLRVKVTVPLEYGLVRPDSEILMTTTLDLSASGLRFPSAVQVWSGLHLKMRLRIGPSEVTVIGQVSRVSPKAREVRGHRTWETAVTFLQLRPQDRKLLEGFVRTQYHRQKVQKP